MANRIVVTTTAELTADRKGAEAAVDADIEAFEEWFRHLGQEEEKNDPLSRPERSILKTFLYWKLFEEKKDGTQASDGSGL